LRLLGNATEAEDIAQEVFLKAYEHFDELQDSPTVGGWLKTVARNLSLNHLTRYRARWRFFSDLAPDDGESEDLASRLPAPDVHEQHLTTRDQRELLEQALQKLPASQRLPLVLFHFEDLSYEEIAARLRVSLGKVKTDIHRARESLRRRLVSAQTELAC
jgi:RNA polymerase sigma-70 factor (ECF subfamily)